MILGTFQFIANLLQQHLKNKFGLDQNIVVCNSIIEVDGSIPQINQNKVILSLINIEREMSKTFISRNNRLKDGSYTMNEPAEHYSLDILLSSNFEDYNQSLKFLNEIILFFQIHANMIASTNSNLPEGITKLQFEFENNTYQELHAFWNTMGAKYKPSAIYKMKFITLNTSEKTIPNISNETK